MNGGGSQVTVDIDTQGVGKRLDAAIAAASTELSRERIKSLMQSGAVVDESGNSLTSISAKVTRPMCVSINVPATAPDKAIAQDIPLSIVFEDEHVIVIDKPAGLVVHPAAGNADGTLVNALLHHCDGQLSGIGGIARPGIVHRIDKDTSGLMIAAKTDMAHQGLAGQFADHSIERRYLALVSGHPLPQVGTIRGNIGRSPANRKKMAIVDDRHGKRATTHYRTLDRLDRAALVECLLETGRTHQVRVHMTHIGHPLLGDPAYSRGKTVHSDLLKQLDFRRQALHAAELGFIHPVSKEKHAFKSVLPPDMQELLSRLRV